LPNPRDHGRRRKPPVYLNPGDVVTLSVEGLGTQRQEVVAAY
jgi:2-keto-4-pentenoate hydratase/2-oxohepta-3-ene-1,7-dioic acid hydratase in catechol pathway